MGTSPVDEFYLWPISLDGRLPDLPRPLPDEAAPMIEANRTFYDNFGFVPPWIAYLSIRDGSIVGGGAFVGAPRNKEVEIAYFTLTDRQGQGNARRTARALIEIARAQDPEITIYAKTMPEPGPSTGVLARLGFRRTGLVIDHEIGEAWHWTLTP